MPKWDKNYVKDVGSPRPTPSSLKDCDSKIWERGLKGSVSSQPSGSHARHKFTCPLFSELGGSRSLKFYGTCTGYSLQKPWSLQPPLTPLLWNTGPSWPPRWGWASLCSGPPQFPPLLCTLWWLVYFSQKTMSLVSPASSGTQYSAQSRASKNPCWLTI